MKLRFLLLLTTLIFQVSAMAQVHEHIVAHAIRGVKVTSIALNGTWDFRYSPQSKWSSIEVPGEAAMQGYAIEHGKPIVYRRNVVVPADFGGQSIFVRFDGVYSSARLWVNGKFVREHSGGFTRWDADVSDVVVAGQKNEIQVEVIDRIDDISYASGYAHHPIGGILRDVTLYALPPTAISNLKVNTVFDSLYRNATLEISYQSLYAPQGSTVSFELFDPQGAAVALGSRSVAMAQMAQGVNSHTFAVSSPDKWDAEHPNLYTLRVVVSKNGGESYRFDRRIGFREVKIVGDKMLVNGQQVRLRGACRHDIHPTLGRSTTRQIDSLDVRLFKESNMNFVRTSHYPPSEAFVEFCDRYGLYVECETAVCFVSTHAAAMFQPTPTQSNSAFTDQYLSQCKEMVGTFAHSPSVVVWSVGNESVYGTNFQLCYDWVKQNDPTRPVIFSYPGGVKGGAKVYDILSMHYQDQNGNLNQYGAQTRNFQAHGIPTIFDEWAHPACYTYQTLQDDPNIRDFWGRSIDMMWSGLFESSGGLGGAIWSYVDETFMVPRAKVGTNYWNTYPYIQKPKNFQGHSTGYGEWGIVDVWRRHKPEFWSTKKAYSPIRLIETAVSEIAAGQRLVLPVYNRFNHTNLSEVTLRYTYNGVTKTASMPSVAPRQKGAIVVAAEKWQSGDKLFVEFLSSAGDVIDAEMVSLGQQPTVAKPCGERSRGGDCAAVTIDTADCRLTIRGNGFEVPFDKATGLIVNARSGQNVVISSGPFVNMEINLNHLSGAEVRKSANKFYTNARDWKLQKLSHKLIDNVAHVAISGCYGSVEVEIEISIDGSGKMVCSYHTAGEPNGFLREIGLKFNLPQSMDSVSWDRKGYWSYYPKGEFAGNNGSAALYRSAQSAYGERPSQPWGDDTHNYFYWADKGANCTQPLTQKAKAMKENVYRYSVANQGGAGALTVTSPDAMLACRLSKSADEQLSLYINNRWDYPEIAWGNYCHKLEVAPVKGALTIYLQ